MISIHDQFKESSAEIEVKDPLPLVWGDANVLRQVLTQLLSNAVSFVMVGRKPKIRIWAENRDPCIRLWVEDNGIGIAPEFLDRIFWLFERLSQENSSSTGMGLPIARKGMQRMDGTIGVQSTPGVGSRFWIELPAVKEGVA